MRSVHIAYGGYAAPTVSGTENKNLARLVAERAGDRASYGLWGEWRNATGTDSFVVAWWARVSEHGWSTWAVLWRFSLFCEQKWAGSSTGWGAETPVSSG